MKRILFMHQASSIGGGSFCLLNIIKTIDKKHFEPAVALLSEGPLADELRKLEVEVVIFRQMAAIPYNRGLLQRGSLKAYWIIRKSIPALKALLKEKRIDVLYLNNMMLCRYLQPAKECGCKTVVHIREHWPLNEHKHQLEWARRCVYQYADKLIAINHYSASIFPKKEATIVYDWIDMSKRYKPMPMSEIFCEDMTGKKVLLYTGGAQIIKGADYVVRAFSSTITDNSYRLLILGISDLKPLGGGMHKLKLFLERFGYYYYDKELREMLSADPRIKYIPALYELNHLIDQSYCFVSYFRIPHANLALAENIILGNPCIAADTEEAREYSGDGRFAKLVSPMNDCDALAQGLKDFLNDIDEWRNAAKEGAKEIETLFCPANNALRLNGTLKALVGSI